MRRKIHDRGKLLDELTDNDSEVPDDKEQDVLSPYAVEFHYDIQPLEAEFPFDRAETRELVRKVRKWVEEKIKP